MPPDPSIGIHTCVLCTLWQCIHILAITTSILITNLTVPPLFKSLDPPMINVNSRFKLCKYVLYINSVFILILGSQFASGLSRILKMSKYIISPWYLRSSELFFNPKGCMNWPYTTFLLICTTQPMYNCIHMLWYVRMYVATAVPQSFT